jgi:hypothetical protein
VASLAFYSSSFPASLSFKISIMNVAYSFKAFGVLGNIPYICVQ